MERMDSGGFLDSFLRLPEADGELDDLMGFLQFGEPPGMGLSLPCLAPGKKRSALRTRCKERLVKFV